ncbi:MAG: ECF transporter S component [Ruminococcaceae bacterium]|nr:ECF transporter S component [Oscillospiraceae bacterium]
MKTQKKKMSTEMLVTGALMTALVILFQLLATYTTFFGPFSTAIGLVPIAIGSILCGPAVGAWLGFVFAIVVFATGGANLFLAVDVPGTIVTVLSKGVLCGLVSGFTYKALSKFNSTIAAFSAAIVCPVVNTGVFLLGCFAFFMDDAVKIAEAIKSPATGTALFIALALGNFLFELGLNTVLSPVVVKILNVRNKG